MSQDRKLKVMPLQKDLKVHKVMEVILVLKVIKDLRVRKVTQVQMLIQPFLQRVHEDQEAQILNLLLKVHKVTQVKTLVLD